MKPKTGFIGGGYRQNRAWCPANSLQNQNKRSNFHQSLPIFPNKIYTSNTFSHLSSLVRPPGSARWLARPHLFLLYLEWWGFPTETWSVSNTCSGNSAQARDENLHWETWRVMWLGSWRRVGGFFWGKKRGVLHGIRLGLAWFSMEFGSHNWSNFGIELPELSQLGLNAKHGCKELCCSKLLPFLRRLLSTVCRPKKPETPLLQQTSVS